MSQLSGAFTIETDRLVEEIAQRTAVILVGMLRAAPSGIGGTSNTGTEVYDRPADPDPGAGRRHGARFGAVTDDAVEYDQP